MCQSWAVEGFSWHAHRLCGILWLAAAVICVEENVEENVADAAEDVVVKKELGAEQSDQLQEETGTEEVEPAEGGVAIQVEEVQGAEPAQEVQLSVTDAPPNGDLTPEMILSMMDR